MNNFDAGLKQEWRKTAVKPERETKPGQTPGGEQASQQEWRASLEAPLKLEGAAEHTARLANPLHTKRKTRIER
jgi:hypothetical protein